MKNYGLSINLKEAESLLEKIIKGGDPCKVPALFLWGPPGIGKSSVVRQVVKKNNLRLIDLRLSLLDPVDLRGVPIAKDGSVIWARPSFIPAEGRGILFLDEINQAAPAVQAAAFQLVLDRRVGDHTLGSGWFIVAAGNREEDSSIVYKMPDPLVGRFVHLEIEVDLENWIEWAITHSIDERVIAFIKTRPEFLLKIERARGSINFPSPRGWEFASQLMKAGWDPVSAVKAACGTGAGIEFLGFLRIWNTISDVEKILSGGEVRIPSDPSILYALCSALICRAKRTNIEKILSFCLKMAKRGYEEYSVYLLKGVYAKYEDEIKSSSYWEKIIQNFSEVVL